MKAPLAAWLEVPGRSGVDVSDILDGFSFRLTAKGGFAGAQGTLHAALERFDIRANSKLTVTDGRTAETLWQGYLESPGDTFDDDGESFDFSAQGAMTLVGDMASPLLYLDTSMEHWRGDDRNDNRLSDSSEMSASAWPDSEVDALMLSFSQGAPIEKGSEARMVHDLADQCPMGIGGWGFKVKSGLTTNGYEGRISLSNNGTVNTFEMRTSTLFPAGLIGLTHDNAGDILKIRLRRIRGATNIGTDRIWMGYAEPYVVGNRLFRDGTRQLDLASDFRYVLAWEVVEDLVARMMPMVDPNRVYIERDTTKYQIDQLTYADPTRATGVLEDLDLFEPDMVWGVRPSGADGRFGFTYRDWPDTPRFEISIGDGYEAPGSDDSQCNRIAVGWTDRKGREKTEIVTRNVPELGGDPADAGFNGRIVDADKINLDKAKSSRANARRIGSEALRLINNPPKAATATVVRRLRDRRYGGTVAPWEIEPGHIARLRETGENLRITEVEVNADDLSATLTLGEPQVTIEQLVARLANDKTRRR